MSHNKTDFQSPDNKGAKVNTDMTDQTNTREVEQLKQVTTDMTDQTNLTLKKFIKVKRDNNYIMQDLKDFCHKMIQKMS